jgi:hypothetical protein
MVAAACTRPTDTPPAAARPSPAADAQHAGITTPHGDHAPHHGGLVMMAGDLHYEIVIDPTGRYAVWLTDAVRQDLPASVARNVGLVVSRKGEPSETLTAEIDESGESWIASGRPLSGTDLVMVKVSFSVQGQPVEVDLPYLPKSSSNPEVP